MYVMPSGVIELYSGVPMREDYQNTLSFRNETEQRNYFVSKRVQELTDQLYTRRASGVIRIKANIVDLMTVDYLSFKNHGTLNGNVWNENKRFYCFVANMAYVNENVTDLFFVIDVIQTYMFDITYKESYIEQTHVPIREDNNTQYQDFEGDYILPQNVDVGEYYFKPLIFGDSSTQDIFGDFVYVVAATFDKNFNNSVGGLQNGFYSGLTFNVFDNINDINNFLLTAASNNKSDGIVNIFMSPRGFVEHPALRSTRIFIDVDIWDEVYNDKVTYTPRNKILYCWPFTKIVWTDNNGNTAEYGSQLFSSLHYDSQTDKYYYEFEVTYVCAGFNEISIYPINYKGVENNYNEQIVLNITPQCAFATDSYRAWLAQNSSKMSVENAYASKNAALANEKAMYTKIYADKRAGLEQASANFNAIASAAGNAASEGSFGGLLKNAAIAAGQVIITNKKNELAESENWENYALAKLATANDYAHTIGLLNAAVGVASTMPPHASGNASGMSGTVNGGYRLSCYACVPCPGMVRKLDNYFDMWGYRVDRLQIPNFKSRKYWNYIRCAQFNAEGTNIPGTYFDIIKTIFERGITFWHDPTHFLDYSQDNHQNYVN